MVPNSRQSIYSIATTPGLNPLFPALTITIANVAPHMRHIGVQASTRLVQLFKAFSAPHFLLADEGHPRLAYYLLETFNSVLYNQLNENPNLIYAILQSHQDFQKLATFSLLSGLRDIQKKKALRAAAEERAVAAATPPRGLVRTNSELAMLAEKAALLAFEEEDEDDTGAPAAEAEASAPTPPPVTPATEEAPETPVAEDAPHQPMSEKARGKMRATEADEAQEDDISEEELMRVAAAGVGPNGYVPTQEWVTSWQKK